MSQHLCFAPVCSHYDIQRVDVMYI